MALCYFLCRALSGLNILGASTQGVALVVIHKFIFHQENPKAFNVRRARTKSNILCMPIHMVLGPGGPSCFLPRYPSNWATIFTNSSYLGTCSGGGLFFKIM